MGEAGSVRVAQDEHPRAIHAGVRVEPREHRIEEGEVAVPEFAALALPRRCEAAAASEAFGIHGERLGPRARDGRAALHAVRVHPERVKREHHRRGHATLVGRRCAHDEHSPCAGHLEELRARWCRRSVAEGRLDARGPRQQAQKDERGEHGACDARPSWRVVRRGHARAEGSTGLRRVYNRRVTDARTHGGASA